MKLHQLTKTTTTSQKRLGRGGGSGKGFHTSSRGQKGQKSRSKIHLWFEGGQLPLSKRLPFLRGKDRFKSVSTLTTIVNLSALKDFSAKATIDKKSLMDAGIISEKEATTTIVKILGHGELTKAYTFKDLTISKSAQAKIEKAGGNITTTKE